MTYFKNRVVDPRSAGTALVSRWYPMILYGTRLPSSWVWGFLALRDWRWGPGDISIAMELPPLPTALLGSSPQLPLTLVPIRIQSCNGWIEILPLWLEWHHKSGIIHMQVSCDIPIQGLHCIHPLHHLWGNPLLQILLPPPVSYQATMVSDVDNLEDFSHLL